MKKPAPVTPTQARSFGKEAALAGRPKESCPFLRGPERKAWMDGHRKNATFTRVDLSAKPEPTPEPVVEPAPAPVVEAPAPLVSAPVVQEAPKVKAQGKGKPKLIDHCENPFKEGTVAAQVTARLLTGAAFDLEALFNGIESKCPTAIIGDLRRKALPVTRNEQGKYVLAVKGAN